MTYVGNERKEDSDGWTPRQSGRIYCSPRCGGNCTRKAFDAAKKDSAALATALGPQWKANVWENLGWHWSVTCGEHITVHPAFAVGKFALTMNGVGGTFTVTGTLWHIVAAAIRHLRDQSELTSRTIAVLLHTRTDHAR